MSFVRVLYIHRIRNLARWWSTLPGLRYEFVQKSTTRTTWVASYRQKKPLFLPNAVASLSPHQVWSSRSALRLVQFYPSSPLLFSWDCSPLSLHKLFDPTQGRCTCLSVEFLAYVKPPLSRSHRLSWLLQRRRLPLLAVLSMLRVIFSDLLSDTCFQLLHWSPDSCS